ncbi:hypothetical protein HpMS107_34490 [Helicobacter pylori]
MSGGMYVGFFRTPDKIREGFCVYNMRARGPVRHLAHMGLPILPSGGRAHLMDWGSRLTIRPTPGAGTFCTILSRIVRQRARQGGTIAFKLPARWHRQCAGNGQPMGR